MSKLVKEKNNLNLDKDGIFKINNLFNSSEIISLNKELDSLFNTPSFNGNLGCRIILHRMKAKYRKIILPTLTIRSVNLLEKCIEIRDVILQNCQTTKNWKLTALDIYEEKSPGELFWHTDNRSGMLRAFIYIEGGREDSGAFQYMKGTQNRNYYIKHTLSAQMISNLKDTIFVAKGSPGSGYIADTHGFHANKPKHKKRRIMVVEFQPDNKEFAKVKKTSILIPSFALSKKVKENLELFENNVDKDAYRHSNDFDIKDFDPRIDAIIFTIPFIFKRLFSKYKSKIKSILKKNISK